MRLFLIVSALLFFHSFLHAQRFFTAPIQGKDRTYLYKKVKLDKVSTNKPLIIILHKNGNNAKEVFYLDEIWANVKYDAHLVFPNAYAKQWNCEDSVSSDVDFIQYITENLYKSFLIDRNRIYLITDESNSCLVEQFNKAYPDKLASFQYLPTEQTYNITNAINNLLASDHTTETQYELWEPKVKEERLSPIDSLIKFSYHKRVMFTLHGGFLSLISAVKTEPSDGIDVDLSDHHTYMGFEISKWMSDSIGWFVDYSKLSTPKEEASGKMVRGTITSLTVGLKYAFSQFNYRPYFFIGSGPMSVTSFEGSMGGSMNGDRRMTLHTTIGTGLGFRFKKRFIVGSELRYIHSAEFDDAGSITAVRGFNLNFNVSYIFNAKHQKTLLPLLNNK
ncbi:acyloxyacyl hydrolase [Chondrinema litorale]|uniref:acyloxyacyl hydrolase n=1 Tax=Chondrinema litorale TaxID=2994555 RepID=UPI002542B7EC|nr:hypothetical protein [Chondrinema litorale]UZR97233.1 hypothetical protein OQ292_25370 [Chondrinema litorale]